MAYYLFRVAFVHGQCTLQILCRCQTSKTSDATACSNVGMKSDGPNDIEQDVDHRVNWNTITTAVDRVLFIMSYVAVFIAIATLFPRYWTLLGWQALLPVDVLCLRWLRCDLETQTTKVLCIMWQAYNNWYLFTYCWFPTSRFLSKFTLINL